MPTPQVLEYIRRSLEQGVSADNIKKSLRAVGWQEAEIDSSLKHVQAQLVKPSFPSGPRPNPFVSSQKPLVNQNQEPQSRIATLSHETPHHTRKAILLPILFVIIMLLSGTVASAFYFGVPFSLPFFKPSPEFVLREAVINFVNAKSFEYEGWLQLAGEDATQEFEGSLRLHYSGGLNELDVVNPETTKAYFNFDISAEVKDFLEETTLALETRILNKLVYFRFTDIPDIPFLGDLSAYENQWIYFEPEDVDDYTGGSDFSFGDSSESDVTDEQWEQMNALLKRSSFFIIVDEPTDEKLEGNAVHHYHVFLDGPGLIAFYREAYDILQPSDITREELEEAILEFETDEIWQQILATPLEIWIDKKMLVPVKLSFTADVHDQEQGSLTIAYELILRNVNEPVSVVAPSDARLLDEVVEEVTGTSLAEVPREARDSQRLSDLSALQSSIALYLITVSDIDLDGPYNSGTCADEPSKTIYHSLPDNSGISAPAGWQVNSISNANLTNVDGSGWMPIDLTRTTGGSPLARLPIDPENSSGEKLFYTYVCNKQNNTFEMSTNLESSKFFSREAQDGGDDSTSYETGTAPGLRIAPKGTHTSTPGE